MGERIATSVELRHSPSEKAASGTIPTSTPSSESLRPTRSRLVDADQIGKDLVGVDDAAVAVAVDHEVAERVDQAAEALLAFLQLPHAVGEVLDLGAAMRGILRDDRGCATFGMECPGQHESPAMPVAKIPIARKAGAPVRWAIPARTRIATMVAKDRTRGTRLGISGCSDGAATRRRAGASD